MTQPDISRPPEGSRTDVTLVARGFTVTAVVEVATEVALVVRPDGEGTVWKTAIHDGDPAELYWIADGEERTLPARVVEVEPALEVRWHLVVTGAAQRSQRRKAVRGRVALPVYVPWSDGQLVGETVDLSEAGVRALVDGWGLPPDPGTPLQVGITVDEETVHLQGHAVWLRTYGPRWMVSLGFDDVPEREGDLVRKRVFRALREERARGG